MHWNEFIVERASQQLAQLTGSQVTGSSGLQWADGLGNSILFHAIRYFIHAESFLDLESYIISLLNMIS